MMAILISMLLSAPQAVAINNSPYFMMSPQEQALYMDLALRSVVAVNGIGHKILCTGTLISQSQVLTSAHCFDPIPTPGKAVASEILLMGPTNTVERRIGIKKVSIHYQWEIEYKTLLAQHQRLKAMHANLKKLSKTTTPGCSVHEVEWENVDLPDYLAKLDVFAGIVREPADSCDKALLNIHDLLKQNRKLISEPLKELDDTLPADLAVVELEESVKDGYHQPMSLDFNFEPVPNDTRLAFIFGFGLTSNAREFGKFELHMGFTDFRGMVSKDQMKIAGSAVLCPGDSGGPTAYVKNKKMILVGVNAGTTGCDYNQQYSESLSVAAHALWLKSIIRD